MAKKEAERLIYEMHAQLCSVFSNAKRLEIINLLREGEKTVGELTKEMGIPKTNAAPNPSTRPSITVANLCEL